jgi:hypothetical protein
VLKVRWSEAAAARGWLGMLPLFDPSEGITVREPMDSGAGWWAGAPSATFDSADETFYIYYRLRKPRELGRGTDCRIAASRDGISFEDIWAATRDDFDSPSVERSSLIHCPDGLWRLYISYVDPSDGRWRTDLMEAPSPGEFDVATRTKVFVPDEIDAEGVKDPVVLILGGLYYMLLSYAPRPRRAASQDDMHGTADVFNTGVTKSSTGLATSVDGRRFDWQGDIFAPRDAGWDSYCTRISTGVYVPPMWTFLYDGSSGVEGNYEERCGIAVSSDLKIFHRLSVDEPVLTSPHASGSLRYVDAVRMADRIHYYYEYARPDGSHELRVNIVSL